MLGFLLIIIIILYFCNTNKKITELEKENEKLKEKIEELLGSSNKDYKKNNTQTTSYGTNKEDIVVKKDVTIERKNIIEDNDEKESKNTSILITGAFLIVLSAIVFLMSTWNAIPNIMKTIVLGLLVVVFLGASKIAKEKFKLEKTSNTFFYIAMAYIPICLLACSVFELFGKYFSINGEGRYIYLTIAMTVNSLIYYYNYKIRKINGLFYGSILSQIFALILFGLIFGNNFYFISTILLAYNILLILLTKKDTKLDLLKYFYNGNPYVIAFITLFNYSESTIYMLTLLIILTANFLLLYLKKNNNIANSYLFNISLYSIGMYFTEVYAENLNVNLRIIIEIVYIIFALLIEGYIFTKLKDEKLIKTSMIISLVSMTLTYFWLITLQDSYLNVINPYVVSIIETLLMLFIFTKSKELGKKVLGYLIPILLVITFLNILQVMNASYHFYIISSLMIFVIGELIVWENFKLLNKGFLIVSNIILGFIYLACSIFVDEFYNDIIYLILLEIVYIYSYIKNKNYIIFKYLAYANSNFVLLTGFNFIDVMDDIKLLIPVIVSCGTIFIESNYDNIKDAYSDVFSVVIQILAYYCILLWGGLQSIVISLLYSIFLIYDNLKFKKISYMRIIPLLGFLSIALSSNVEEDYKTLILLFATISLSFMSIYKKQVELETIFSGIYLLFVISLFDNSYIKEIILLIWSITNLYFIDNKYAKDVFKTITYVGALLLYETFAFDLNLLIYESFEIIGVVIFAIAVIKNIINKYIKDVDNLDALEYVVYILINLFAIASYVDEKDGMIYVLFLVCLLIFSYTKKYGALFIVSMFTILGNVILLTREFWFNVPWWIYLLLVGSILIAFAIKNESDENKQKKSIGNFLKILKDKIEK